MPKLRVHNFTISLDGLPPGLTSARPIRGPWKDESWTGWWGENPPFHNDVFVLTHHPRESLTMESAAPPRRPDR